MSINSDQRDSKGAEDFGFHDTVFLRGRELNKSQQEALQFLKEKNVEELFNFLIEHLLVNSPRDPLSFLVDLLDKCIDFRDNLQNPPLLFDRPHQEIIYKAFDPGNRGFITLPQYRTARKTAGLEDINPLLSKSKDDVISKKVFLNEIDSALINQLYTMVGGIKREEDIARVVRGSLVYVSRHREDISDSASLLLHLGSKESSVRFFLAVDERLDEFENPKKISHTEFLDHISSKFPLDVKETSNFEKSNQMYNEALEGSLESENVSDLEESECISSNQAMDKSVEETSLNSATLDSAALDSAALDNESFNCFPSFENMTKEGEQSSEMYKFGDNIEAPNVLNGLDEEEKIEEKEENIEEKEENIEEKEENIEEKEENIEDALQVQAQSMTEEESEKPSKQIDEVVGQNSSNSITRVTKSN